MRYAGTNASLGVDHFLYISIITAFFYLSILSMGILIFGPSGDPGWVAVLYIFTYFGGAPAILSLVFFYYTDQVQKKVPSLVITFFVLSLFFAWNLWDTYSDAVLAIIPTSVICSLLIARIHAAPNRRDFIFRAISSYLIIVATNITLIGLSDCC